jgi:hypothetical protein
MGFRSLYIITYIKTRWLVKMKPALLKQADNITLVFPDTV